MELVLNARMNDECPKTVTKRWGVLHLPHKTKVKFNEMERILLINLHANKLGIYNES